MLDSLKNLFSLDGKVTFGDSNIYKNGGNGFH